jgi:hypothetical protein
VEVSLLSVVDPSAVNKLIHSTGCVPTASFSQPKMVFHETAVLLYSLHSNVCAGVRIFYVCPRMKLR